MTSSDNLFIDVISMRKTFEYEKGYTLEYLFFPGKTESFEQNEKTLKIIREINRGGLNLNYGIFKEDLDRSLLNDIIICLIRHGEEYHGFFYTYVVDRNIPVVHQGLVMIVKNAGADLLTAPYYMLNRLIYEELGKPFYATNISAVPKIIGAFTDLYSDVWPSPQADLTRCAFPEYRKILDVLKNDYIQKVFPFPEGITLDKSRFVLKSKVREMGFETDFHKLSRDAKYEINLFTFMWLKHEEEEDMVQIGKYTPKHYADTAFYADRFKEITSKRAEVQEVEVGK